MDSVEVFQSADEHFKEWLRVNDNGTVTYHSEISGWQLMRRGPSSPDLSISIAEAKAHWPSFAGRIDEAYASLKIGS